MRGHLILVHNKSLKCRIIQKVTKSYYDHIGIFENENSIIEARLNGVIRTSLKDIDASAKKNKLDYKVYRIKNITEKQKDILVDFVKSKIGAKYDLLQLFSIGLMYLFNIARRRPAFDMKERWICSELIAEGVYKMGMKVSERFHRDSITPSEIAESSIVELVTQ